MPAYNEAALIQRTLGPLSNAALDGYIELVVVCNGCSDDTADRARSVPGTRVLELARASKPAALNAGDDEATLWPRLYLDADIQISAEAVLAILDRLAHGDVLVVRPARRYDTRGASALVRSYFRAGSRISRHKSAIYGAGAYGLNEQGHERLGAFPAVTGDDLYVDTLFNIDEKAVVSTDPVVVKTPADARSLLAILHRSRRARAELLADRQGVGARARNTSVDTVVAVLRSIRGPRSAADAAVYLGMKIAGRLPYRNPQVWERDDSSRSDE
jgi:glycosyltransferase involved in cell wall biosynthesis